MLTELKIDRVRHVYFEHKSTEERLAETHCNEMENIKAHYETLFNVRKRKMIKTNDETLSVEQLIRNIKANEAHFLGIEQGSGKFTYDLHFSINSIRKKKR